MSERHWLTPNAPPAHKAYVRRVVIPADLLFIAPISGALVELTYPSAWEKHGDLTPEETAEIFSGIYQQFLPFDNQPPDWETPDELDGLPEQPWYEDLADWVIAGFLAITFTPQAAVVYTTTVPRLRVALRTGNLGALFRVLINGVEVWTGDSYTPLTDIIEQTFDMSAETEPYTVRIEHNGVGDNINGTEAKLEVIRGKALADMVATILRADPTGCGVQWSTDNGDTWDTVDLATCITGLANDAIIQAVNSGYLQRAGGQPGPSSPPEPEACKTYHIELPGNGQWHLPSGLGYGDTLLVENVVGGWCDGSLSWWCGDGSRYLAGACSEELKTHETGDVLNPGAYHMALVMQAGETWYAAPLTTFTQNSGTTPLDVVLQANDGSLSDNTGSIAFDLTVCTGAAGARFCYEYDFTVSDNDWYQKAWPVDPSAVYSVGNGWGFGGEYNVIERNFGAGNLVGTTVDTIEIWRSFTPDADRSRLFFYDQDNQQSGILHDNWPGFSRATVGGLIVDTWVLEWSDMLKLCVFGDNTGMSGYVKKVVLRGPTPAFWVSNCS